MNDLETLLNNTAEETRRHSFRVEGITAILCEHESVQALYSKEVCNAIISASRYHDIGKTQIPDDILYSGRKLTSEEFDIIKKHPVLGREILQAEMKDVIDEELHTNGLIAVNIALLHHQRFDGSGYPSMPSDMQLPTYVELVALADVMEALTAKRSYKEPIPVETAYNMVMEGKCGEFSPFAKQLLTSCLPKVQKYIAEEHPSLNHIATEAIEHSDIPSR